MLSITNICVNATDSISSPENIHLAAVNTTYLTFQWSESDTKKDTCSRLAYYIVHSSSCGECPEASIGTSVMCSIFNVEKDEGATCTFKVQTAACINENTTVEIQNGIVVTLSGKYNTISIQMLVTV